MARSNIKNISEDKVDFFIKDILIYLDQGNKDECTINEAIFGMKELFRGYIVRVW